MVKVSEIKRIMAEKIPVDFQGIACIVKEYRLKIIRFDAKTQFAHCALLQELKNQKVTYEVRLQDIEVFVNDY